MHGYPHFSFWIPITHAKIYFFPIAITFAKYISNYEAPSLNHLFSKSQKISLPEKPYP